MKTKQILKNLIATTNSKNNEFNYIKKEESILDEAFKEYIINFVQLNTAFVMAKNIQMNLLK